jgi:hypothetical protein
LTKKQRDREMGKQTNKQKDDTTERVMEKPKTDGYMDK